MRLNRFLLPNNKKSTICCKLAETMETVVEMETFRAGDKDGASNLPEPNVAWPAGTEAAADKVTDVETAKTRDVSEIKNYIIHNLNNN